MNILLVEEVSIHTKKLNYFVTEAGIRSLCFNGFIETVPKEKGDVRFSKFGIRIK